MKVAVPAETAPGERRVALVPDAVPQLVDTGLEVLVQSRRRQSRAGHGRRLPPTPVPRSSARWTPPRSTCCCTCGRCGRRRSAGCARARSPSACARRPTELATVQALRDGRVTVVRDGAGAADLPRPVDGRAHLAGAGRRLPLRAGGGDAAAPVLPAVHDRRRHRAAGQGAGARRRAWPGCRRSPPPAGSARWSRPTTCARPAPTRCARWAPPSSSSTWSRWRAPAATPGR